MKKRSFRRILAALAVLIFIAAMIPMQLLEAAGSGGSAAYSRGQWMSKLVDTFDMTIEDGIIPDDYYGDISGSQYYDDILIAMNFGVIELEPGEDFNPDGALTREFAAETLNYCLGFQLESDEYTMGDVTSLVYADAAQVAINRGWFALVSGNFMPEQEVTEAEITIMLNDAATILAGQNVNANYEDSYELTTGVKEIPEGTEVELSEDGKLKVTNSSVSINKDDKFVTYINGIAYPYKATAVSTSGTVMTITVEELEIDDCFDEYDAEGSIDVNMADIVPSEGVEVGAILESGEEVTQEEYSEMCEASQDVEKKTNIKDITLKKKVGSGTIQCKLTNITVDYKLSFKEYKFIVNGKKTITTSFASSASTSIPLGIINIAGVGDITVSAEYSASGSIAVVFSENFSVGIENSKKNGFRVIKKFTKQSCELEINVSASAGIQVALNIRIPFVATGQLYAGTGIKATAKGTAYSDGKVPGKCMTIKCWLYAEVGYGIEPAFFFDSRYDSYSLYDYTNSPIRICMHIEDGKQVDTCARENASGGTGSGKRHYYTSRYAGSSSCATGRVSSCYSSGYYAAEVVNPFTYTLDDDGNATLTKYNGSAYSLVVPKTIDDHPVTAIGSECFKNNKSIGVVNIPDGVLSIGSSAFYECSNLTMVTIADTVTEIGSFAFYNCDSLTSIYLPKSLKSLGGGAFYDCNNIYKVFIPKKLESVGLSSDFFINYKNNGAFDACNNLTDIEFEEGITSIPGKLFYGCNGLKLVNVPSTITTIGTEAFYNCSNLEEINFSDNITAIGSFAFYNCDKLGEVKLPNKIKNIYGGAFFDCNGLEKINIPKTIEYMGLANELSINYRNNGVFDLCDNLTEIEFENGITTIPSNSLYGCTGVESISIPDSVTEIGSSAFSGCTNLTHVSLPNSITEIDGSAFSGCIKLADVKLPERLSHLRYRAFYNCDSITSIEIPKSLESYDSYSDVGQVFAECDSLKTVSFESGTTEVVDSLLKNCTGLEVVNMPETVKIIGYYAFENCENISEIQIPDSVTEIGCGAFEGCISLGSISIPDKVIAIYSNAFSGCTSLESVSLSNNLEGIYNNAFYGCSAIDTIILPSTLTVISSNAFYNCVSLSSIELPASLTRIDNSAFRYCKELTEIAIPDKVTSIGTYAFANCDKLASVDLGAGATELSDYCFYQDPALVSIILPQQITTVGSYAFGNCTKFNRITMNKNVSSVDSTAFSYPEKLTIVGIKGSYANTFATNNSISFEELNRPSESIVTNDTNIRLGMNSSYQISAKVIPTDSSDQLAYTSTDEDIVTVSNTGLIESENTTGTASIVIMAGTNTITCDVTVYKNVTSVYIGSYSYTITKGETKKIDCTVYPSDAENKALTWASSDTSIATVDTEGNVTGVAFGTVTITATSEDGGETDTCTVNVEPIAVTAIKLDKTKASVEVGKTVTLTPTITPANATDKSVIWTSTNSKVATVKDGVVTGVAKGTAIIIAKTTDGNYTANCTVTVTDGTGTTNILVTSVTLNKTSASLTEAETLQLTATVAPANATNKAIDWISSNTSIAKVDSTGKVTAVKAGTATITATSKDGSGKKGTCSVTVKAKSQTPDPDPTPDPTPDPDPSNGSITALGIYIMPTEGPTITAGLVADKTGSADFEYYWIATHDAGASWEEIQDWTVNSEWINWNPKQYGDYIVICKARVVGHPETETSASVAIAAHPKLKGICQLPYEGEGGGYLIGMETYDNQDYSYEMLILDCTLYAQGKDAWVYSTGKCKTDGSCLWTIWQPQYGYYWTLFRIYDKDGNLVDEQCFGFENI